MSFPTDITHLPCRYCDEVKPVEAFDHDDVCDECSHAMWAEQQAEAEAEAAIERYYEEGPSFRHNW